MSEYIIFTGKREIHSAGDTPITEGTWLKNTVRNPAWKEVCKEAEKGGNH